MKKITTLGLLIIMMLGLSQSANAQGTVKCSIPDGSTLTELLAEPITFEVEGATDYTILGWAQSQICYVNEDGSVGNMFQNFYLEFNKDTNKLLISPQTYHFWPNYPFQKNGKYVIVLPEKAFSYSLDGTTYENAAANFFFTIESPEKFVNENNITWSPEPGEWDGMPEKFTITLPEDVTSVNFVEVAAGSNDYYGTICGKAQVCRIYENGSAYAYGTMSISAEGNVLTLTPDGGIDISGGGTYAIRLLRGAMYFNGDEEKINDLIYSGNYIFPERAKIGLLPEPGNPVLTWPESFEVDYTANSIKLTEGMAPTLNKFNEETQAYEKVCDMIVTMPEDDYSSPTLSIDETTYANLEYGKYRIIIEKGLFTTVDWDENELINGTVYFDYEYVATPEISLIPTWSVQEGETLSSFSEVVLTFSEASEIATQNEWWQPYMAVYQVVDGQDIPWGTSGLLDAEVNNENKTVRLYLDKDSYYPDYPIEVDGDFKIVVPAGKLYFEGIPDFTNEELVLTFKIDAVDPTFDATSTTIDPAPALVKTMYNTYTITVNDVDGELSVADVPTSVWNNELGDYEEQMLPATASIYQVNDYGQLPCGLMTISVEDNIITLTPDPTSITEDQNWSAGQYKVVVPKGAIIIDGDNSKFNAMLSYEFYEIEMLGHVQTITPEPGLVDSLFEFNILFDTYEEATSPSSEETVELIFSKYDSAIGEYVPVEGNKAVGTVYMDWDTWECLMGIILEEEVTEAGKYKLSIPRGTVKWTDWWGTREIYDLEEFEAEYVIADSALAFEPVSVDPEDGSELLSFEKATLTYDATYFPNGLYDLGATVSVLNAAGEQVCEGWVSCPGVEPGVNPTLVVYADEEITTPGTYTIVVPEGTVADYVSGGMSSSDPQYKFTNPEIRLTYIIPDMAEIFKPVSITPAEGEVDLLKDFTIEFDATNFADGLNGGQDTTVRLYDAENNEVANGPLSIPGENNYSTIKITLNEEITTPGTYTLVLAKGQITDYVRPKYVNPEMKFVYTIKEVVKPVIVMTITPVGGSADDFSDAVELPQVDDTTFTIEISGAEKVEIAETALDFNNDAIINFWDIDADWNMGNNSVAFYPVAVEGEAYKFNLVKFADSGVEWPIKSAGNGFYCLNIPEGIFMCDGFPNDPTGYYYKVKDSGIEVVDMDAQDKNVYSVSGMLIKRNASWREIMNLEPGVYVVNGEKVYIRK